MDNIIETVRNFFLSAARRPRVQLSVLISTIVTIIIVRYVWSRIHRGANEALDRKLSSRKARSIESTSSSSSTSKMRRKRRDQQQQSSSSAVNDDDGDKNTTNNEADGETKSKTSNNNNNNNLSPPSNNRVFGAGHERLGHVVTVRVKNEDCPDLESAAKQFAASLKGSNPVHVVLRDTAGVQGELRQPTHAPLWIDKEKALAASNEIISKIVRRGRKLGMIAEEADAKVCDSFGKYQLTMDTLKNLAASPTFTVHTEKSVRYSLDADRVMFCSGNTTERMHFGVDVNATGETVVDMFAGIGYFTIPLSSCMNRPNRLIAIEKNPESCAFLACNALLNDCYDRLVILNGDNREVGNVFVGKANRVLMGYIPCCKEFLPRAVSFLTTIPNEKANKGKAVSFAAGSTPPQQRSEKKENDEEKNTTSTNEAEETSSALSHRPIGVIHYHYLSESKEKNAAKATAQLHVLESLGAQVGSCCEIKEVRVVKSYAPKKFHCVADLHFE